MNKEELFNYVVDNEIVSYEELVITCNIDGYNLKTLEYLLYAKTGYNSIKQLAY